MPYVYRVLITRGAMKMVREFVPEQDVWADPLAAVKAAGVSTAGRVCEEFSAASRANMRFQLSAVDWEVLDRPVLLTLTYPKAWREVAGSDAASKRHLDLFRKRWAREWGEPMRAFWVREFQQRGAPHFHLYCGLPAAVGNDDYESLVRQVLRRKRLEARLGKYDARNRSGLTFGSAFHDWVVATWAAVVASGDANHARWGANVYPCFWGHTLEEAKAGRINWGRLADYFWRESGKWGQKTAPEGYGNIGRSWGRWGLRLRVLDAEVESAVWYELRRPAWEILRRRIERETGRSFGRNLGRKGLTTWGLDEDTSHRLLLWAHGEAAAKRAARAG